MWGGVHNKKFMGGGGGGGGGERVAWEGLEFF